MVDDIDKATEIFLNSIQLNDICHPVATQACMRLFVSLCLANGMNYKQFYEGIELIKKDYKRHCDALQIR